MRLQEQFEQKKPEIPNLNLYLSTIKRGEVKTSNYYIQLLMLAKRYVAYVHLHVLHMDIKDKPET